MTQAMKGEAKAAAFWFKVGLKYFEDKNVDKIDRHLVMLGLFYASRNKKMMAEGLYRQVLSKNENEKYSYTLVMALNFYGRMLLSNPKRSTETTEYLK